MQRLTPRTLLYPLFAAILCVGAMTAPAQAGPSMPAATDKTSSSSPVGLQIEARKIIMQLNQIEHKAVDGNTRIEAQRQSFSEHVLKVMEKNGYNKAKDDMKQMVALRNSIMSGKLKKAERTAKIKAFQTIRMRYQKAEQKAMQDKSLRQESRKISQATMVAMKKQDPNTEKLLKRLNQINQKLRSMYQAAQERKLHTGK